MIIIFLHHIHHADFEEKVLKLYIVIEAFARIRCSRKDNTFLHIELFNSLYYNIDL